MAPPEYEPRERYPSGIWLRVYVVVAVVILLAALFVWVF